MEDRIKVAQGIPAAPLDAYSLSELRGRVRVAEREFRHILKNLELDEILITEMTDASQEVKLMYAKGLVTERGGLLCHAAIFANSIGIPCITGATDITKKLRTGDYVEFDYNGNIYLIR